MTRKDKVTIMKESIKNKVDLLISNKQKIETEFKWGYSLMNIAAALVFTGENREVDIERLKLCKQILKKNTGVFSSFRSYSEAVIVSKMANAADPEQYINDVKFIYEKLKRSSFSDSSFCSCNRNALLHAVWRTEQEMNFLTRLLPLSDSDIGASVIDGNAVGLYQTVACADALFIGF